MARQPRKTTGRNALVAAATRISLRDRAITARQAKARQQWQGDAWAYFDEVPEIKQAMLFLGNALSKLRLYVASEDEDGNHVPVTDPESGVDAGLAAAAAAELQRLAGGYGGLPEVQRQACINLEVAGEFYLIGFGARLLPDGTETPERWCVASVSQVTVKDGRVVLADMPGDTQGTTLDPEVDTWIRVWQQHPQWAGLADCSMRGVLTECRILQALEAQQVAEANSRRAAGLLLLPNELSFGPADPAVSDDGEEAAADPFMETLLTAIESTFSDPEAASSVMPVIVRGPSDHLASIRHLALNRDADATLDERIEKRVMRIARGLNMPVEVIEGHMSTTFANAEQIDQDLYDDHLDPRAVMLAEAFTAGFLRPNLLDAGFAPEQVEQVHVWYDPSRLVREPDQQAVADEAYDRGAISDATYRRVYGFDESDAPEPLELIIRSGLRRGILTAELTAALLRPLADRAGVDLPDLEAAAEVEAGLPVDEPVDAPEPAPEALPASTPTVLQSRPPLALSAASRPDYGQRLTDIDSRLRDRLTQAADDHLARALERAGNRIRTQAGRNGALRDLVADTPAPLVASMLGPNLLANAGLDVNDTLDGAFDGLRTQFMTWGEQAFDQALDVASQVASGFTTAERSALMLRQAGNLDEAWSWLQGALRTLTGLRLFDPNPAAPDFGEFDPTSRVPTGMIRAALARAGGALGVTTDAGSSWVAVRPDGQPYGGIATGDLMIQTLRERGAIIEGYRWVYGAALRARPFQPHMALDGRFFTSFTDPVLTNGTGWPPYDFYLPGDHAGCLCDFALAVIPAPDPDARTLPAAGGN